MNSDILLMVMGIPAGGYFLLVGYGAIKNEYFPVSQKQFKFYGYAMLAIGILNTLEVLKLT